ncbi:MAG TPA: PEP-CTERM sorting domain-containing protein [Tepidisphaeraceae bacterium]|nr:PEP-CTERM sorting domain-containing protein [Tepidisphaeraceae bacterium]
MKSAGLTFAIAATGALQAMAAAPAIHNLGTLGGDFSTGNAINNSGQVTGWSRSANGLGRAFLYTPAPGGGTMANLGTLSAVGGSIGYAINDAGQVVGDSTFDDTYRQRAFLYTGTPGSDGTMHNLGVLYDGFESFARSINAAGHVVGASSYVPMVGDYRTDGFLYTGTPGSGGAMIPLIGISAGDINDAGQLAGGRKIYTPAPGGGWTETDIGTLGGILGGANAINNAGQVTGRSEIAGPVPLLSPQHAFLYTGGTMFDLGTLPGDTHSGGLDINAAGHVVGWSNVEGFLAGGRAFLYTGTPGVNGQMIDLNAWLDTNNPIEGANWTLLEARGINDYGLITGEGIFNDGPGGLSDGTRAFTLDASSLVPEPSSALLVALGGVGLLARRRKPVLSGGSAAAELLGVASGITCQRQCLVRVTNEPA